MKKAAEAALLMCDAFFLPVNFDVYTRPLHVVPMIVTVTSLQDTDWPGGSTSSAPRQDFE
jgi:hypothetical protein